MQISQAGKDFIRRHEPLNLTPHVDERGHRVIGYGHMGMEILPTTTWSMSDADYNFEKDVQYAAHCVNALVLVPLTQNQFDALASFVFDNTGIAFTNSAILGKLNAGDYAGAAEEIHRWCARWNDERAGFTARREEEYQLFTRADK